MRRPTAVQVENTLKVSLPIRPIHTTSTLSGVNGRRFYALLCRGLGAEPVVVLWRTSELTLSAIPAFGAATFRATVMRAGDVSAARRSLFWKVILHQVLYRGQSSEAKHHSVEIAQRDIRLIADAPEAVFDGQINRAARLQT